MSKDTNIEVCPDCKGDGRPFAKDGSRNGNAKCQTCGGSGRVHTPPCLTPGPATCTCGTGGDAA